jgi:hypothetical protein
MRFYLPDQGENITDARSFKDGDLEPEPAYYAEAAVRYIYDYEDGHEFFRKDGDIVKIVVVGEEDNITYGTFEVSIDWSPSFYARKIK